MRELDFEIQEWLAGGDPDSVTHASLSMIAGSGPKPIPVTEVYDAVARTVRSHIYVPVHLVARWLLVNWWRLRWEPRRATHEWRLAHSMASIGEGYAWPPVQFSSDGEFIHTRLEAEGEPDVAAVRYLRDVALDIPAVHFESAVDHLVSQIQQRLSACRKTDQDLEDVRAEHSRFAEHD